MTAPTTTTAVSADGKPRRLSPKSVAIAVIMLLAIHFVLAVSGKRQASTTSDELAHLTAGTNYWRNHDYRLHPENGILPQRWAALPVWLSGARFPALEENEYWRTSDVWVVGHQFFYETGDDHFPRLMAGRAMIALFSVATGIVVFLWSRRLFGIAGGLISLTFFAFSPDFLAHGALVTSDACMAFFLPVSVWAWWQHLHTASARIWWLSAVTLGLAFVAKYSAVLLVPMMILMAAVRAFAPEPLRLGRWTFATRAGKFGAAAMSGLGHAVVVAVVIWGFYGFRYSAANPALPPADHFIMPWEYFIGRTGALGETARMLAAWCVLPEAFLYGFDYVLFTTKARAAFLNGEHSVTGWRTFFIWTFLLKSTLPVLLATVILIITVARHAVLKSGWLKNLYPLTPLIVLLAVYGGSSIASQLNIGHRHILPLYPVLFIATGAIGAWFVSRRLAYTTAVVGLLVWHAAEAIRTSPHHLAYFNGIAGGPQNGWRHLVDSSLDWGQDLPGLKIWLDQHVRDEPVFLSYFGAGQPAYYKIKAHQLNFINNFKFPTTYVPLRAGVYCISATVMQQVYTPVQGPWTREREKEYQELRGLESHFTAYSHNPQKRADLTKDMPADRWDKTIQRHDWLRMARLTSFLRLREPDASAGHSILIYRLTEDEVHGATAGSLTDWRNLIQQAAEASR